MQTYKLSCANCTAPLEVSGATANVTCRYCGSTLEVEQDPAFERDSERDDGALPPELAEANEQASRRASRRTDLELAIYDLTDERDDVLARKEKGLATQAELHDKARKERKTITAISAVTVFIAGGVLSNWMAGYPMLSAAMSVVWLVALPGVPLYVFFSTKVPAKNTSEEIRAMDAKLARVNQQLAANQALQDKLLLS